MIDQTVMLKVEAAAQAAQLPGMTGKSFTVAKTVTAGDGISKWLVLMPQGGAGKAAEGVVVMKVEGGKQILGNMVGQTFTVGKAPLVGKGAGTWLVLQPKAAASATGVKALLSGSAVASAPGGVTAMTVNGVVAAAAPADPTMAMLMKGIEVEAPDAAVAATKGALAKGAATKGVGIAVKGGAGAGVGGAGTVAMTTGPAAAVATKGAAAAGGTIWSGTGTSLGLGLGLGAWGPVILVGTIAAVGVGVYTYLKNRNGIEAVANELNEAVS